MKKIALFNQSGGVGKTTLTFNVGHQLAALGKRVLLIDMDPQASLTTFCGIEPEAISMSVYEVLTKEMPPLFLHVPNTELSLIPATINLAGAEIELASDGMRDILLREGLAPQEDAFDFILIDCPPSLGVLSVIALNAADGLLVPIQPEYKTLMGTGLLLETYAKIKRRSNKALKIVGFVPSMYASGTIQHERGLTGMREQLANVGHVFNPIPRRIDFANSSEKHLPLALYNPKSDAIAPLKEIAAYLVSQKDA